MVRISRNGLPGRNAAAILSTTLYALYSMASVSVSCSFVVRGWFDFSATSDPWGSKEDDFYKSANAVHGDSSRKIRGRGAV